MVSVLSLAYLAVFALYQGDSGRCALPRSSRAIVTLVRLTGYLLIILVTGISVMLWGAERGLPSALVALCLTAPLSLLLASRWPRTHLYSAPLALAIGAAGLAL